MADDTDNLVLRQLRELRAALDSRFDNVDARFDAVDKRLGKIETNICRFRRWRAVLPGQAEQLFRLMPSSERQGHADAVGYLS